MATTELREKGMGTRKQRNKAELRSPSKESAAGMLHAEWSEAGHLSFKGSELQRKPWSVTAKPLTV